MAPRCKISVLWRGFHAIGTVVVVLGSFFSLEDRYVLCTCLGKIGFGIMDVVRMARISLGTVMLSWLYPVHSLLCDVS